MNIPSRSHLLTAFSGVIFCVTLVGVGILIEHYHLVPLPKVVSFAKSIERSIRIWRVGDDKFVNDTLSKHYPVKTASSEAPVRRVDTSRLPLLLEEIPLDSTGEFAGGEQLTGGALAKVGDALLVMDKLGNVFDFDFQTKSLRKLDYGVFPNGIREGILNAGDSSPLYAMRAHYMAYDPITSTLYVSLLHFNSESRHTRFNISAISIDKKTLEKRSNWRTIFESEDVPEGHGSDKGSGGRLLIANNMLYFTIGDFGTGAAQQGKAAFPAQSLNSSFGKIFEYDLSTQKVRLKSLGHRNPQGLTYTQDGRLLSTEQGPQGGDALNVILDGRNYGWPYRTYGTEYGKFSWPIKSNEGTNNFFEEPLYTWIPSPAISPMIQISTFNDAWTGDLLIGSLKAQSLFRLRLLKDRVLFSEPIWIGHRIRDIVEFGDQIILITDDPALIIVRVDEERLRQNVQGNSLAALSPVLSKCMTCHHFGETNPSNLAPTLAHILDRPIASDGFDGYSDGLKKKGGVWDEVSLRKYITNPNEFAPGTTMPNPGLSAREIDDIITLLKDDGSRHNDTP
jgi:cytochrome c2